MPVVVSFDNAVLEFLVYAAIAVITLIGLFKCIYPLWRNASLLNRAVVRLERNAAEGGRPLWHEARFLGRSLRTEWQQFLYNAGQMDMRGMPCDLNDYLNEETVLDRPGHAQLAELIPGLLTSLGILGTFMGLMQGLTDIDFTTAEGTITSIPQLLSGMRFAFATSVAGISCSLLFNMLNRMAAGRAMRALHSFEDAFYELAMTRPLQADVQLMCQKQDEEARLARLAENVGNHIAASLEVAVGRAMAPLTQSLDTFIKCATREQVDGVRRIVGQFVQQLNASLNGQMTALGDTMTAVTKGQIQAQQNLKNALETSRSLAESAKSIQDSSAQVAHTMKELSDALNAQRIEQNVGVDAARTAAENIAARLEALGESLGRMQSALDRLSLDLDEQPAAASQDGEPTAMAL